MMKSMDDLSRPSRVAVTPVPAQPKRQPIAMRYLLAYAATYVSTIVYGAVSSFHAIIPRDGFSSLSAPGNGGLASFAVTILIVIVGMMTLVFATVGLVTSLVLATPMFGMLSLPEVSARPGLTRGILFGMPVAAFIAALVIPIDPSQLDLRALDHLFLR